MHVYEGSIATFQSLGVYYWELKFSREINFDVRMKWVYGACGCFNIIVPSVCHIEPIEQLFSVQNGSVNCCFIKVVEKQAFQKCSPVTTLNCD